MTGPLVGITVIDLTEGDGAPFCAMQLGDAGADVIKVEPLEGDWARPLGGPFDHGDGPLYMGMNRSKRSIAVDLDREEGRAIVRDLARQADVLVHNFTHTTDAARLGLDYASLAAANPRLVYCDISTLDRTGPDADVPATDLTVQARSALLRFTGRRGEAPVRYGSNWVGVSAAMYAMGAILAAIWERRASGLGQAIETSYLRAAIAAQNNTITSYNAPVSDGGGGGVGSPMEPPAQGVETLDGYVEVGWNYPRDSRSGTRLLEWLGIRDEVHEKHPALAGRPIGQQDTAVLRPYIAREFKKHTQAEMIQVLLDVGLMFAPVHDYGTYFSDPGILEQDVLRTVEHPTRGTLRQVSPAWQMDGAPAEITLGPPTLGEHTDAILAAIGYDAARIASLRARGIVR